MIMSAPTNGLVLYYNMETINTDGKMKDLSGSDNHGTLIGTSNIAGKVGWARNFNGTTDGITAIDTPSLSSSDVTVSLWVYIPSTINCDANNNWRALIRKGSVAGTTTGWDIVLEEGLDCTWDIGYGGATHRKFVQTLI